MATPKIRRFELSYLNSGFESEHDSNSYETEMFDRIRLFWPSTGQNRPSREFPYQFRLVEDSPLKAMFSHSFFSPYPTNSYSNRTFCISKVRNRTFRISQVRNQTLRISQVRNRTLRISHPDTPPPDTLRECLAARVSGGGGLCK